MSSGWENPYPLLTERQPCGGDNSESEELSGDAGSKPPDDGPPDGRFSDSKTPGSKPPVIRTSDSKPPNGHVYANYPMTPNSESSDTDLGKGQRESTDTVFWANVPKTSFDGSASSWAVSPASYSITTNTSDGQRSSGMDSERASLYELPRQPNDNEDEDDGFGEDTEHIDFVALKGHLNVFRPAADVDVSDHVKGKYVFYSMQTGLLRHHVLADVCKYGYGHGLCTGLGHGGNKISPQPSKVPNLSEVMRSGPFWLDICDPTREELRSLSEIFKMHPLTLEGLESEGEEIREKCDVFEKYYFICIKAFESDSKSDDYMLPINLYMLVSPSCVVTIHRDPLEFSHTIAKRMRLLTARTGLTSDWIVYTILEDVLEMFVPSVRSTEIEIDSIDEQVGGSAKAGTNSQSHSELLGRIANSRRRVTQLIRLMSAKSELLRVIAKRCGTRFSEDAHLYLRDLQDHTAMVDQILHQYDESLNRSHANYLALLSIEISETSNHMSDVMKKLTAASTVALPWSMITGLMGMNIFVPGGESYHNESWIPWLVLFVAMSVSSVIIYFVGRRRDWF